MCDGLLCKLILRIGTNFNIKLWAVLAMSWLLTLSSALTPPAFAQPSSSTTDQSDESTKSEGSRSEEESVQAREESVVAKEEEKPIKITLKEVIGTAPEALEHITG